ncbi:MAG TPA: hypothetical protein VEQ12_11015, partial [Candidatus Limnocylindria bacterium]|nr:hypothetical protein [Candidatus Limnocylindria bacterium]
LGANVVGRRSDPPTIQGGFLSLVCLNAGLLNMAPVVLIPIERRAVAFNSKYYSSTNTKARQRALHAEAGVAHGTRARMGERLFEERLA